MSAQSDRACSRGLLFQGETLYSAHAAMTMRAENDTEPDRPSTHAAAPREKAPRLAPGTRIGHAYTIRSFHKRGGMAEIYLGYHDHMMREVAIKVLQEEHEKKPHIVRGLQREARALAAIASHPNLVSIYDSGVDPETQMPFVVMEMLHGRDLREMLTARGESYPVNEAVAILITLTRALSDLHDVGIFHRDLKPENIFLQAKGKGNAPVIKLLDLGAALTPERLGIRTEEDTRCIGTFLYMSPEQITRGLITPASDMYALGHVLYEMLRGRHAFGDVEIDYARQGQQYVALHLFVPPESLVSCVPGMPEELSKIVDRMLEKKPEQRYASMAMLTEVLVDFMNRYRRGGAEEPGFLDRLMESQAVAEERHRGRKQSGEVPTGRSQEPVMGQTTEPDVPLPPQAAAPRAAPRVAETPSPAEPTSPAPRRQVLTEKAQLAKRGTMRIEIGTTPVGLPPTGPDHARLVVSATVSEVVARDFAEEQPDSEGVFPGLLAHLWTVLPAAEALLEVDSLLVVEGPEALLGLRYPLGFKMLTVGRDATRAALAVPHVTVSRIHCELVTDIPGVFEVIDASRFGIEINDLPGTRGLLRGRGRLRLGEVVLEMVRAGETPSNPRKNLESGPVSVARASVSEAPAGTYLRKKVQPMTVPSSRQMERIAAERASQSQLAPASQLTISSWPSPLATQQPVSAPTVVAPATVGFGLPSASPVPVVASAAPEKASSARFIPPESSLARAGSGLERQKLALETHRYIATLQEDLDDPKEAQKVLKRAQAYARYLWDEAAPRVWLARNADELEDHLFLLNELEARAEMSSGADVREVFEHRLAKPTDWKLIASYHLVARTGFPGAIPGQGLAKVETPKRRARDLRWVFYCTVFLALATIGYSVLVLLDIVPNPISGVQERSR